MIINCDLIIKNGKVFEKNRFKKNHIVIKDGKIFKLTKNIKSFKSKKIINADKKIVIPGIIDIHFHVRAPSFPQRGTVQSETKAAAKGGITTLFEMPISNPCPNILFQIIFKLLRKSKSYQKNTKHTHKNYKLLSQNIWD